MLRKGIISRGKVCSEHMNISRPSILIFHAIPEPFQATVICEIAPYYSIPAAKEDRMKRKNCRRKGGVMKGKMENRWKSFEKCFF